MKIIIGDTFVFFNKVIDIVIGLNVINDDIKSVTVVRYDLKANESYVITWINEGAYHLSKSRWKRL